MSFIKNLLSVSLIVMVGVAFAGEETRPIYLSADGSALLRSTKADYGLTWFDRATSTSVELVNDKFVCYYATLSADGRRAAFKNYKEADGVRSQLPCVYLRSCDRVIDLAAAAPKVGCPTLGPDGLVAWTVGNVLFVSRLADDGTLTPVLEKKVYDYANHCAFTSDGALLALTLASGDVKMIDVLSGKARDVAKIDGAYAPQFSPDGKKLMVSLTRGNFAIADVTETMTKESSEPAPVKEFETVGFGDSAPVWLDNTTPAYTQYVTEGDVTVRAERVALDMEKGTTRTLASVAGDMDVLFSGDEVLTAPAEKAALAERESMQFTAAPSPKSGFTKSNALQIIGSSVFLAGGFPYFNQVYDVLASFSGGYSCCNAASALIVIQYFNVLPPVRTQVSRGNTHFSDYGTYISEPFTVNGTTFNRPSSSAWGSDLAGYYGLFGWFLQDGSGASSLDRSKRLASAMVACGLSSYCDDYVSGETGVTKARTEINNEHPFIMLVSITSSGHYLVCVGYVQNQHTLIFYDPYGNKNVSYPSRDGRYAYYDTPGYNNGYANLKGVWRFIYGRAANPTNLSITGSVTELKAGGATQLTARSTMNNGSTKSMTNLVTWGSSYPSLVSVSPTGRVTVTGPVTKDTLVNIWCNYQNYRARYALMIKAK